MTAKELQALKPKSKNYSVTDGLGLSIGTLLISDYLH